VKCALVAAAKQPRRLRLDHRSLVLVAGEGAHGLERVEERPCDEFIPRGS
jgi:hypothetical protein